MMVNGGLIRKSLQETWLLTGILGAALFFVAGLLAYVLPTFQQEISQAWMNMKFVQDLLRALLGSDIGDRIGPHVFQALPWVHPLILALIFTHQLTFCTRTPVGEIDRGTIDVLLGLPISRWELYLSETLVFLVWGVVLLGCALLGNTCGSRIAGPGAFPPPERVVPVVVNSFCLYLAVGGVAFLFSALGDRRGKAIGCGFAVVLVSFLLTFLAEFWEPAKGVVFLSILDYYRPAVTLREGVWPLADMAVLLGVAATMWTSAGIVFQRRDVCTV